MVKRESNDIVKVTTHITTEEANPYKKVKDKHWLVYYYLLSKSFYNNEEKDYPHRYVYKSNVSPTAAAKELGISRSTVYRALELLSSKEIKLISITEEYYIIPRHKSWAAISKDLLNALIGYSQVIGVDLIRSYLFIVATNDLYNGYKTFTRRNLVRCLGHNETDKQAYKKIDIYLDLLEQWQLVYLDKETKVDELGTHYVYRIVKVNNNSEILENRFNNRIDETKNPYGLSKFEEEEVKKYI